MMATKNKSARLESEIEKGRVEGNWDKVVELLKQITNKTPGLDNLARLLIAESKVEKYLKKYPPNESNIPTAKSDVHLTGAKEALTSLGNSDPKLRQEALLLLAKVHYARGQYQEALSCFDQMDLEKVKIDYISSRKLKLIAEGFAIKGLMLEKILPDTPIPDSQPPSSSMALDKVPPATSSKFKAVEREEQIIHCYEKSGDLSLLHMQELDKNAGLNNIVPLGVAGSSLTGSSTENEEGVGPILETAIQRSPIIHIKNGNLDKGISRFRELLRAVESRTTQPVRQVLARQLAEVLLRGVCDNSYAAPDLRQEAMADVRTLGLPPKPRRYSGGKLFVPQDLSEETLLLLLISEAMATREALLSRSPEFKEARLHTFHNSTAVYDLLTIALVKRAQFHTLSESFERAMKFSFDEFHIWYQFALSLIGAEKYSRALLVLRECHRLSPNNPTVPMLAAKVCFENLHLLDEGLEFAKQAVEVGEKGPLGARTYVALGVAFSLKAEEAKMHGERQELHRKALNSFLRAHSLDSQDHIALFHIALQQALLRKIHEALKHVRMALRHKSDHVHSLHLLALLLSSQKKYEEGLDLLEAALAEYPHNFSLLFTKSKLEEMCFGTEDALVTCKHMFQLWKDLYEPKEEEEQRGTGLIDKVTADRRSLVQLQLSELSDRDSSSVRAESIAASRVEQALSEVASSLGSSLQAKSGAQHTWVLQAQIWLHLAELYLNMDKLSMAQHCVAEAGSIFPLSHQVSHMKGRVYEAQMMFDDGKACYLNSLAINPQHVKSMQHLGMVLHYQGRLQMAEKELRDAVNIDPTASQTWHNLGTVLQALGDMDSASECLMTAVELESTNPVLPFTVIPKVLN